MHVKARASASARASNLLSLQRQSMASLISSFSGSTFSEPKAEPATCTTFSDIATPP